VQRFTTEPTATHLWNALKIAALPSADIRVYQTSSHRDLVPVATTVRRRGLQTARPGRRLGLALRAL